MLLMPLVTLQITSSRFYRLLPTGRTPTNTNAHMLPLKDIAFDIITSYAYQPWHAAYSLSPLTIFRFTFDIEIDDD